MRERKTEENMDCESVSERASDRVSEIWEEGRGRERSMRDSERVKEEKRMHTSQHGHTYPLMFSTIPNTGRFIFLQKFIC